MYNNYNKAFKYVDSLEVFNSKKVSAMADNSAYVIGDSVPVIGTPEILWENICFIELERLIWTHGIFYNEDDFERFTDEEILAMIPEDDEILDLMVIE
jgi:hypothetical protein